jgi:hypothetical protein
VGSTLRYDRQDNQDFLLYLKFPEEIPNEQSATPRREAFGGKFLSSKDIFSRGLIATLRFTSLF